MFHLPAPAPRRIETALLEGRPLRDIERQWGVSRSALSRHQDAGHVAEAVRYAHRAREADRGQSLLDQVHDLKNRVSTVLDRAQTEDNPKPALMAARELRGCLDLLGRVMGELNPQPR